MVTMTKLPKRFVPTAAAALAVVVASGSALCAWQGRRLADVAKRPVAVAQPTIAYPVREARPEAESAAQIDGMSFDAENALVRRTDFYFHHGDYPRIIALCRIATEIDPHDVDTYSNGAWLMESDRDYPDAQAYYSLAVTRNPTSSYAALSLAQFYYGTLHNYPAAEAVLTNSVHDADAGPLDWKLLAHTYEQELRYDKAVKIWKIIQRKYPTAPAIKLNLNRDEGLLALQQSSGANASTSVAPSGQQAGAATSAPIPAAGK